MGNCFSGSKSDEGHDDRRSRQHGDSPVEDGCVSPNVSNPIEGNKRKRRNSVISINKVLVIVIVIVTLRSASDFVVWGQSAFFASRTSNSIPISDHGQSVTSSLEYCNDKNVSIVESYSDQHGITANGRNATTQGRRQFSSFPSIRYLLLHSTNGISQASAFIRLLGLVFYQASVFLGK